jgi:hypothetical protein
MGASGRILVIEIFAASGFLLFAILGFKRNLGWLSLPLLGTDVLTSSITCFSTIRGYRVGGWILLGI